VFVRFREGDRVRIAMLVKQIPKFEEMELGPDGRLRRDGVELEMNPYCRRAVSKAVELAGEHAGSRVTVFTLGPPAAEDTLREAIAWGLERDVEIDGVLVTDPAFAGSDTLATARALAAVLRREGPFDLVLTGRNSVDADTGQVGPELAELLDLPFLTGVRYLAIEATQVAARCEHDDGWMQAEVKLPALLSCAERLCEPTKVDPPGRAAVPADRIRRLSATDLGAGPWGVDASPTSVGPVKVMEVARARHVRADAPLAEQVRDAVRLLVERDALHADNGERPSGRRAVSSGIGLALPVAVLVEPDRAHMTRELLGAAAALASEIDGDVVAFTLDAPNTRELGSWGADRVQHLRGENVEEDVAAAVAAWAATAEPWAIIAGSTAWGREVASRVAARLGAGLTGDAVDLEVVVDRLVAWKPAFGGQLVAAIEASSPTQMATVRPGMLTAPEPRVGPEPSVVEVDLVPRGRVRVLARTREDDLDTLADATAVIGVGRGVPPNEYDALEPLRMLLGAELGATRKVTDEGWLPRARQIGITGRSIAPRLFVSIGASGKFNHAVGLRAAGTVLAINPDPDAPIFQAADIGIVADWRDALPLLVSELNARTATSA
jgi:electron transfer flavoprotein alpha subunit